MIKKLFAYSVFLVLTLVIASCVVHRVDVVPVDVSAESPIEISSPVKAHLFDGSTVVFPEGVNVYDGKVHGKGERFNIALENNQFIDEVALDEVAAMESFQTPVNTPATAAATTVGTAGWVALGLGAAFLVFGSCPTVYSMDPEVALPEAELFSYSITPSFQARDIDKLGLKHVQDGYLELDIRNEMLETHYIDQLEILEVTHAVNQAAYPDSKGYPIVVGTTMAPVSAVDQDGRDILLETASADGQVWSASSNRLANVSLDDFHDFLDFEFKVPKNSGEIALVLKMRNSLLNTVLLYDVMLKEQSFAALDWMGHDLNHLGNRAELGLWYRENMGMTVSVWRDGKFHKVGRIGDQGPIAWSERALVLDGANGDSVRIRLSFVADNWRIDQVALAVDAGRAKVRTIPVSRAKTPQSDRPDIPEYLVRADETYLITRPGESVQLGFEVGESKQSRTFFLASEGYYMEWMRSQWLAEEHRRKFEPTFDALIKSLVIYAEKRDTYREQFESIKVSVR
jgi:hypothetical protein